MAQCFAAWPQRACSLLAHRLFAKVRQDSPLAGIAIAVGMDTESKADMEDRVVHGHCLHLQSKVPTPCKDFEHYAAESIVFS